MSLPSVLEYALYIVGVPVMLVGGLIMAFFLYFMLKAGRSGNNSNNAAKGFSSTAAAQTEREKQLRKVAASFGPAQATRAYSPPVKKEVLTGAQALEKVSGEWKQLQVNAKTDGYDKEVLDHFADKLFNTLDGLEDLTAEEKQTRRTLVREIQAALGDEGLLRAKKNK